jgi:non-homologous end joining protein Ku
VLSEAITKTNKVALTRVVISQRERTVAPVLWVWGPTAT